MALYQAFQLTIQSELEFPELYPLSDQHSLVADVVIQYGKVSEIGLESPIKKGLFFQAKQDTFWLHIPNIARFLVTYGSQITIDAIPGVDEDSIRVFLLGSCFGALLMQRGLYLLHGNAIQIGQHAISFTGRSGAGKSTLSGAFYKRGYSILADDVCAINAQGNVIPSFPQIKLWADAAAKLTIDTTSLRKIRPNIEKYAVPLGDHFQQQALPLKVIYILNPHNKEEITIQRLSGVEKFKPLRFQSYRPSYLKGLSLDANHKKQCGELANRITLARITRPNSGFSLDQLAEHIELDLKDQGLSRD